MNYHLIVVAITHVMCEALVQGLKDHTTFHSLTVCSFEADEEIIQQIQQLNEPGKQVNVEFDF